MLLRKYNKTVPETWDDLLDTATYIIEKEKELGNEDLVGYLGYFPGNYFEIVLKKKKAFFKLI